MINELEEQVMTISKEETIAKLQSYRQALHKDVQRTDKLMRRVLRNLKKYNATRLIDISNVILRGGMNETGQPKLAIARADWEKVRFEYGWRRHSRLLVFNKWDGDGWNRRTLPETQENEVRIPRNLWGDSVKFQSASSAVPMIPVEKRPVDSLENYWILWEATWKVEPPRDPYLLRRIDNSLLFVVIDQWDLTELERLVMRSVGTKN